MTEEYYYKTYPDTLNIGEKEVTGIFLAGDKINLTRKILPGRN